ALRPLGPLRRRLPFRTLFNLVGPLANPARPAYQLVGVPGERPADLVASALLDLGTTRALVVNGGDGPGEGTLSQGPPYRPVESGRIVRGTWTPDDFGLPVVPTESLRVSGPADSAARLRAVFAGESGPSRDVILANAAAALWVAGRVESLREG